MSDRLHIAVTGALGHIGSRLIRALPALRPDCRLLLIDNLATQRFPSLFNLPTGTDYRFLEADVRNAELPAIFEDVDVVVHLAAITDAAGSFGKREEVESGNFDATRRVATACAETGTKLFFPSSTSVYGSQSELVDENCAMDDLRPQSPYAETKLREEQLLESLGDSSGLQFVTGRLGTIFGTSVGMRFHTAVNRFCWQAVMQQPLTVWRTALDQRRPYLDLSDAVRAIDFVIGRDQFDRSVYNILTLNATVNDVVTAIRNHVADINIDLVDHEIMNQLSYDVSNSRFGSLGFEFEGDLGKGVADTIAMLRSCMSLQDRPESPAQ